MNKITVAQALIFAEQHFPHAPERLAGFLEIEVRYIPQGCDGWCVQTPTRSIIGINSNAPKVRQRFTLAHELGHLILGVPAFVGESINEIQSYNSEEEKMVNQLAGKLLLPENKIKSFIPEIPITAAVLKKIANKARVSELVVARRLSSIATSLGLKDALVAFYKNDFFEYQKSETLWLNPNLAQFLLEKCLIANPNPARIPREDENDVVVASLLKNPFSETTTIFLQLVHREDGLERLSEESARELDYFIFQNDPNFKSSLQGCFSVIKSKIGGLSLEEAVELFNKIYLSDSERWGEDIRQRLLSETGQNYIRLRLQAWTKK